MAEDYSPIFLLHDLFATLSKDGVNIEALPSNTKTMGLHQVVSAFVNNIRSINSFLYFPASVFISGKTTQLAETLAFFVVTGYPFPPYMGTIKSSEHTERQISDEDVAKVNALRDQILDGDNPNYVLSTMTMSRDVLASFKRSRLSPELELLTSTQIVYAWTIFETLISDLWEAALNSHPVGLSELRGSSEKSNRTVQISRIQQLDFDLRDKMGTFLRHKFVFTSIVGVRDAYRAAFEKQGIGISEAINDRAFDAASALRHVIAHRAGVCDQDYKNNSINVHDLIPKLELGERLNVTGELRTKIILLGIKACVQLIKSVDGWIEGHRD
jgi:hypothetical protein